MLKKKIWASFQRIIELFTQKFVTKLWKIWVWDPEKPIPDPRSGSATLNVTQNDRRSGINHSDYKRLEVNANSLTATTLKHWNIGKKFLSFKIRNRCRTVTAHTLREKKKAKQCSGSDILVRIRIFGSVQINYGSGRPKKHTDPEHWSKAWGSARQCCGSASSWLRSGSDFLLWCGIRIRPFTLMRIQIHNQFIIKVKRNCNHKLKDPPKSKGASLRAS